VLAALSTRFFRRHPGQLLALFLCLSTGVGAFLAIVMVNQSALDSFTRAAQAFNGVATHRLVAPARELRYDDFVRFKLGSGLAAAAPVRELRARVGEQSGFTLLAIDPLAERALGREGLSGSLRLDRPTDDQSLNLLVSQDLAKTLPQGQFSLSLDGRSVSARVAGTIDSSDLGRLAVADLGALFAALDDERLSRIDLKLAPAQAGQLKLADGLTLSIIERQDLVLRELTRALRTNLLALSLLALLVAVFLIAQSFRYAYLLRAAEFARLRALGLARTTLRTYLLLEAAVLGLLGGLLGLLVGTGLGRLLSAPLGATFAELYGSGARVQFMPDAILLLAGLLLAVLAAIAGALLPLLAAERRSLSAQMRRSSQETAVPLRALLLAASVLLVLGLIFLNAEGLLMAFAGLAAITLAIALLVPAALDRGLRGLRHLPVLRNTLIANLALALSERALSRLGAALAALTIALATPIGLDLMVGSFRAALIDWLDASVLGDHFVLSDAGMSDTDLAMIRALPGVTEVHPTRHRQMDADTRPYDLMAVEATPSRLAAFQILAGSALLDGTHLLVSEAFARKRGLKPGDPFVLDGATFSVSGIFRDYRSEHGVVAIELARYQALFNDPLYASLSVSADQAGGQALEAFVAQRPELRVLSRATLRAVSLKTFERTFALTDQLKLLTAALAGLGVFAALLSLELERAGLDQRLRALGFQRTEILGLKASGALTLGLLSGLLAMPVGVLLATLLTGVINQRAFGWSFALKLDAAPFVLALGLALGATLFALLAALAFAERKPSRALLGASE